MRHVCCKNRLSRMEREMIRSILDEVRGRIPVGFEHQSRASGPEVSAGSKSSPSGRLKRISKRQVTCRCKGNLILKIEKEDSKNIV